LQEAQLCYGIPKDILVNCLFAWAAYYPNFGSYDNSTSDPSLGVTTVTFQQTISCELFGPFGKLFHVFPFKTADDITIFGDKCNNIAFIIIAITIAIIFVPQFFKANFARFALLAPLILVTVVSFVRYDLILVKGPMLGTFVVWASALYIAGKSLFGNKKLTIKPITPPEQAAVSADSTKI
jgi:hypothetical protein